MLKIALILLSILTSQVFVYPRAIAATTAISQSQAKSFFRKSPRLLNAVTTFDGVRVWGATYYFTIAIPVDAGESLQKVVINQRQGLDEIAFNLDKTVAYLGTHRHKQEQLTIKNVIQDEETKAISITFATPIPPGTTFTVGLKPKRNPDYGGVYLFGVTAFPRGQNPYGLYLGPGRLHFYRGNDSFFDH
jgi:hypothetical protein